MKKFAGYARHNCPNCGSNRVFFKLRQHWSNTAAAYWDQTTVFCGGCDAPTTHTSNGGARYAING